MNPKKQAIAKNYFEIFYNQITPKNAGLAVDKLVSDDFVDHAPLPGAASSKAEFKKSVMEIVSAFPQKYEVKYLFSDENIHTAIWKTSVKHEGAFMGCAPTKKEFEIDGITIYEIKNNKITAHWEKFDALKLMTEIQSDDKS